MSLSLRDLQMTFRDYVLQPATQMDVHVVGSARVDARTRLAVYADGYRLRLVEALDSNYPTLHKWIGGEAFDRLARAYLDAHPSNHYSIRWFGNKLAGFMETHAPWREQAVRCELARFEWAMSEAFDAPDMPVVRVEALATIPAEAWPGLRLHFQPSLRQQSLRANVAAIWHALSQDAEPPQPEMAEHPGDWITWRKQLTLYYRPLAVDEAWALRQAIAGSTFGELCEGLCEWIDTEHVALRAAGFLRQWVEEELLMGIEHG